MEVKLEVGEEVDAGRRWSGRNWRWKRMWREVEGGGGRWREVEKEIPSLKDPAKICKRPVMIIVTKR